MELEEMKTLWLQHDKLLKENKMLNEQLINTMLGEKSKTAVDKLVNWEYLSAAVCAILLFVYTMLFSTAFDNSLMTVSYFISLLFIIVSLFMNFYKVNMLRKIDLASGSVTDNAKRMESFRLFISKERLVSITLLPVLIFTLVVVFGRWVRNEYIFDYTTAYLTRIIFGSIAAMVATAILYSRLYFRNIKEITNNLKEINRFAS